MPNPPPPTLEQYAAAMGFDLTDPNDYVLAYDSWKEKYVTTEGESTAKEKAISLAVKKASQKYGRERIGRRLTDQVENAVGKLFPTGVDDKTAAEILSNLEKGLLDDIMGDVEVAEENAARGKVRDAFKRAYDAAYVAPYELDADLATAAGDTELASTFRLTALKNRAQFNQTFMPQFETFLTDAANEKGGISAWLDSEFQADAVSTFVTVLQPEIIGITRPGLEPGSYSRTQVQAIADKGADVWRTVSRQEKNDRERFSKTFEANWKQLSKLLEDPELPKEEVDWITDSLNRFAGSYDGLEQDFLTGLSTGTIVRSPGDADAFLAPLTDAVLYNVSVGSPSYQGGYIAGDPRGTLLSMGNQKNVRADAEALKKFIAFGKDIIASQYPELTQYSDDAALTAIYNKAIETGQSPDQYLQNTFLKPKVAEGTAKKTAEAENAKLVGGELSPMFDQYEQTLSARIKQGKEFGYADADIARAENQLTAMKKNRQAWLEIFAKEKAVNPGLTSQQFFSRIATPAQTATGGIDILSADRPADAEGERIEKMFGETKVKSRLRTVTDPISGAVSYQPIPDDEADEEMALGDLLDVGFGGKSAAIKKDIASRADPATGLIRPMTFQELQKLAGNTQDFTQGVNPFPAATNYRTLQSASAAGSIASQQQLSQTIEREQKARKPVLPKPRVRRYG